MAKRRAGAALPDDPLWYKDAVIYQTHVRAFKDSDGDGIGDFRGLAEKMDYIEKLGVTAIWLLPFYPSPLKDDGYDIADYTDIHPSYGTLQDFHFFVNEAHRRGIRVITELVINHTSDQHPWFQRARRAPAKSRERKYYVWSDTPERYKGVRIIFKDFETSNWTLDPVAQAYFWHRFYSHQPDLNFDSRDVKKAVFQIMDLWLNRGVDGLRLDAVPYLVEREGTSCENIPETHAVLKELRKHVDKNHKNRMLLAEANMWPEDAVAYFGKGDECHMAFHFPLMPRMFMALRMEDRYPIIEILDQTPSLPENCQWATFLRNHDELTLEMVTDRERDYMYQVYARNREARINLGIRRRLAPLLGNNRRAIELMNSLIFSLPGTPVLYYGDEIGMGDNFYLGDRNGVRTPMQWSGDRNAGFSTCNSQRLYLPVITDSEYHYEALNVEAQENNPRSLLWWMRRVIALRKKYKAFSRGELEFLHPQNPKILAFLRKYGDEIMLVVANLSRFVEYVELDLSQHKGLVPVEAFGQKPFPPIGDLPYLLTLGPYSFYWFSLETKRVEASTPAPDTGIPVIRYAGDWTSVFEGKGRIALEAKLSGYLKSKRWFGGKARTILSIKIADAIRLPLRDEPVHVLVIQVEYSDGLLETYSLPLAYAAGEKAEAIKNQSPAAVFAVAQSGKEEGLLYDALWEETFPAFLLEALSRRRRYEGADGEIVMTPTRELGSLLRAAGGPLKAAVSKAQQSNTTVFFGDKIIMKLFRRLESGMNPEVEIGRHLTEKARLASTPRLLGAIEYTKRGREPVSLAVFQEFVPNEGDAWRYTLDYLSRYFERAVAKSTEVKDVPLPPDHFVDAAEKEPTALERELMSSYPERAALLGERTAQLHLALASDVSDPAFAPEPFTGFYQQALYQSFRGQVVQSLRLLRNRLKTVPVPFQADAERVLALEKTFIDRLKLIRDWKFSSKRIRNHGDYHLGQVMYTGKDFVIIDFEGEPARSLNERRTKNSALRDVAGMIRSFHYASFAAALGQAEGTLPAKPAELEPWRALWYRRAALSFLKRYLEVSQGSVFLPKNTDELKLLLDAYLLDKAFYELSYELNNRPDWVAIPLQGILEIAGAKHLAAPEKPGDLPAEGKRG
jgi:maltose alpha-D-glucosyltransferase / alpha-amylase